MIPSAARRTATVVALYLYLYFPLVDGVMFSLVWSAKISGQMLCARSVVYYYKSGPDIQRPESRLAIWTPRTVHYNSCHTYAHTHLLLVLFCCYLLPKEYQPSREVYSDTLRPRLLGTQGSPCMGSCLICSRLAINNPAASDWQDDQACLSGCPSPMLLACLTSVRKVAPILAAHHTARLHPAMRCPRSTLYPRAVHHRVHDDLIPRLTETGFDTCNTHMLIVTSCRWRFSLYG